MSATATPGRLNREQRDALIARHDALFREYQAVTDADDVDPDRAGELQRAMTALVTEYFERLPRLPLSRCPFCRQAFHHSFDPWGVDGFWWQEEPGEPEDEPQPCPHFGVLQGALDFAGSPPRGGRAYEAAVGPGVPFVIPRVLEQSGVIAVIASFPMAGGGRAFPIVYFAEDALPPGSFTQRWTRSSYSFRRAKGGFAWRVDTDPWDFELEPWVREGKVLWIEPGDAELRIRSFRDGACPYVDMEGVRARQYVHGENYRTAPPPAGEEIEPFSE